MFNANQPHLRTLSLKHWGLDGRATEDGRPLPTCRRTGETPNTNAPRWLGQTVARLPIPF